MDRLLYRYIQLCSNCNKSECPVYGLRTKGFGDRLTSTFQYSEEKISFLKLCHESVFGKWKPKTDNIY